MHVLDPHKTPKALAAGFLQDGKRAFFLCVKTEGGMFLELPSVLLFGGDDPVAALSAVFREYAGIDAQVGNIVFEGRYNAGSRRRKEWIPALLFAASAKRKNAKVSPPYSGFRWLGFGEIASARLSRKSEWLRRAGRLAFQDCTAAGPANEE